METEFIHKLTDGENSHLVLDENVKDWQGLKNTINKQNKIREYFDGDPQTEPCWICREIALKLGLNVYPIKGEKLK